MNKRIFTQTYGAVAAILEKDGKILLVKENSGPAKGLWNHPAGWPEVGEDLLRAVSREVEEETGLAFTPNYFLGLYSLVKREGNELRHPLKLVFLGDFSKGSLIVDKNEISESKWFTPEEIEAMDAQSLRDLDIKQMVKDCLSGQKFPLDVITHTVIE